MPEPLTDAKPKLLIGIGQPASIKLNLFGRVIFDVFGELPFLVGSSTVGKQWRDVDVRLILDDDEFRRWCGDPAQPHESNPQWAGLCLAFATLGQQMTGLPIDFQIQPMEWANKRFHGYRNPIGVRITKNTETGAPDA